VLLGGLAACGSDEPSRSDEGAIEEEGDLGVQSVEVGDCFDDPEGVAEERVEVEALGAVPCDQPHDNEAYHLFDHRPPVRGVRARDLPGHAHRGP